MIDALTTAHAREAARLHRAGQPGTFLTQLGPAVLELIYQALPDVGFGFVAHPRPGPAQRATVEPQSLDGFISGTHSVGRVFSHVLATRSLQLIPALAASYWRHPILLARSVETLLYPLRTKTNTGPGYRNTEKSQPTIELLSIMVEPKQRRAGIGACLMQAFVEECRARRAAAIEVTVDASNTGAQRFYRSHGFSHTTGFTLYGRPMCLFHKPL